MKKSFILSLLLSVSGVGSMFFVAAFTKQRESLLNNFFYQGIMFFISMMVIGILFFVKRKFQYLNIGDLNTTTKPIKLLDIKNTDNWKDVGVRFLIIITVVTSLFIFLGNQNLLFSIGINKLIIAFFFSIPLSALNAFNEETLTRWTLVEGGDFLKDKNIIPILSAFIFGIPHYFGVPGGVVGALMAGFMGWFLARSIQETKGIGLAVLIHFFQDVVIFTSLLVGLV